MDVAVKKFMREVEDRRYSDFLAEVSIINRLRHKNIVPLIGEFSLYCLDQFCLCNLIGFTFGNTFLHSN